MLLKMVGLRGKNVTLQYFNKKYVISMLNIWTLLKNECISYFPSALQEAIHISREMPKREEPSTYIFGKDRKLEK
jgi:hypothetical protein